MSQLAARSARTAVVPRARLAWIVLGALLVAAALAGVVRDDAGLWQLLALSVAPDLALLPLVSRRTAPGQLDPRAVPVYNAVHRLVGPAVLAVVAVAFLPAGWLAGALAWGAHVAFDRAAGFGLRNHDGWQR